MSSRKKRTDGSPKMPSRRRRAEPVADDLDGASAPIVVLPATDDVVVAVDDFALQAEPVIPAAAVLPPPQPTTVKSAVHGETVSIDALLLQQQTGSMPRQRVATTIGDILTPTAASGSDGPIQTVDEFVARVLNLTSVERAPQAALDDPFQVTGLSQLVPNPEWQCLQDELAALELRAAQLLRDRETLRDMQRRNEPDLALRDALLERSTNYYEPIDAIKLVKPAVLAQTLTEHWRTLLGDVLRRMNAYFGDETRRLMALVVADAEQVDARVRTFLQHAVNPVLNESLRQLQTATYEDLPLTQETLSSLFGEFFNHLLNTLLQDESVATAQADEAAQVPRGDDSVLVRRADSLLQQTIGLMTTGYESVLGPDRPEEERELYGRLRYLRELVYVYASDAYWAYFEQWYAAAAQPRMPSEAVGRRIYASLERVLGNMIAVRRRSQRRANFDAPPYVVPSDATMVELYEQFIVKKIALHRANALLEQSKDGALQRALQTAFDAPVDTPVASLVPVKLLVRPRADRFRLLDQVYNARLRQIAARYGDDELAAEPRAAADLINDALRDLLISWAPEPEALRAHGVDDAGGDDNDDPSWSPFNLAYPLDVDLVSRQLPQLAGFVALRAKLFDADALHTQATSLRSVLTVGYAEQLVQRELQRVEFALRTLVRPQRDAPLELALPLGAPIDTELRAQLTLRPELVFVLQGPIALRDQRVSDLVERFVAAQVDVVWWFQPTLDAETGLLNAGLAPRVLERQQRVAVSGAYERTATLPLRGGGANTGLAGLYWAEFVINGRLSVRSQFTARLCVTARCARDGAVFELGTEQFGQCTWSEHARTAELQSHIDEWRVLVEHGEESHKRLLEQRRFNALVAERTNADGGTALLYLPPWGNDDETSLLSAMPALLESDDAFSYRSLLERAFARLGAQVRALAPPALTDAVQKRTNLSLLALLADDSGGGGDAEWRALRTVFAQHAATGAFVEPSRRSANGTALPELPPAEAMPMAATVVRASAAVPRDFVLHLGDETPLTNDVMRVPFATLLALSSASLVWYNLTWRERRFIEHVRVQFEAIAAALTRHWNVELTANALAGDQSWWQRRSQPGEGSAALQDEIWRRLAAISPDTLRVTLQCVDNDDTLGNEILFDRALRAEFDSLVESRLLRTGLASVHEYTRRDPLSGYLRTYRSIAAATDGNDDSTGALFRRDARQRQVWGDAHTHETDQPTTYLVELVRKHSARVKLRGSQPCGKSYDFAGLHRIICNLAERYTALAKSDRADFSDAEFNRLEVLLGNLELAYNYLAFVATSASAQQYRHIIDGSQLLELVAASDARNFFTQIRRNRTTNSDGILLRVLS